MLALQVLADVLRATSGASALALAVLTGNAASFAADQAQRVRFWSLAVIVAVLAGSNLAAWGGPLRWQLVPLALAVPAATWGTWLFVRKERARRELE
jgi:hypothetical protein